jgi:hypothetical protein
MGAFSLLARVEKIPESVLPNRAVKNDHDKSKKWSENYQSNTQGIRRGMPFTDYLESNPSPSLNVFSVRTVSYPASP